jgi:tetratricopeptide (TPR) repeat protein
MQAVVAEHRLFGRPVIKGNLDQIHPAKLIFGFFKAKKTGALRFNEDTNDIWLYLVNGCLAPYERGVYAQDDFARNLVRVGLLGKREYALFSRRAEREKSFVVQMLIDENTLDREMVRRLAEGYFERGVIGVFSWRRGTYTYFEKPELEGFEGEADPLRTVRWILDGIRLKYHPNWIEKRLEKRIDAPLKVFAEAPLPLDRVLISEGEREVGDMIRQGVTLARLIATSRLTPAEVRALVYGLLTIECVKFEVKNKEKKPRPARVRPEPPNPLENLFREAEASLTRIHLEAASELAREREAKYEGEPPAAAAPETPQDVARQMLETLRHLQAANAPAPAPAPNEDEEFAEALAAAMTAGQEAAPPVDVGPALDLSSLRRAEARPAAEEPAEPEPAEEPSPPADATDAPPPAAEGFGEQYLKDLRDVEEAPAEAAAEENEQVGASAAGSDDVFAEAVDDMTLNPDEPPDQLFKMGAALLEQGQYHNGYRAIAQAIEKGYATPEAKIQLGWAEFHAFPDDPERFTKATELVQQGIDQDPKQAQGYLWMGKLYLAAGDKSMAELYLVRAVEVDRDCRAAKELIRKLYSTEA